MRVHVHVQNQARSTPTPLLSVRDLHMLLVLEVGQSLASRSSSWKKKAKREENRESEKEETKNKERKKKEKKGAYASIIKDIEDINIVPSHRTSKTKAIGTGTNPILEK